MSTPLPILSLLETRVLGVLAEKQRTVPDSYPLTLNSLVSGCNQKTSRNPVLELTESQVQAAIDSLKGYSLVAETSGGRAFRYEHNTDRVLRIPSQSVILLTVLMLRGPQTAGELRIACDRMHNFADISSVEGFLEELAERPAGALVVKLARLPGARESRWAHLLSGAPAEEIAGPGGASSSDGSYAAHDVSLGEVAALKANVARLEAELATLKALVGRVCSELGISEAG
ncbi:YceH family protein [Variovorax sp. PAMC26660]|uniref:YceH family protein n=1 Tax=Variovorax sp. PAMC26660 TaxID=2762322 RepID=UPI00164DA876|nr:YceH family protein [Variovorax sp. PAMC26660]QNK69018.1 YceH family protein [Variovorax sp. PAMC26660]